MLLFAIALAWLTLRAPEFDHYPIMVKILTAVVFVGLVIGGMICLTTLFALLAIYSGKHQGLVGEHILEIHDEGLFERTEFNQSVHRWSGFAKVLQTRKLLLIYVTDALVHVVPMRAFPSKQQARAFVEEIEKRVKIAKNRMANRL